MKASDLFVKALENEGVEYIFGVPGEENLDLIDSLRNSSIKLVVTRHEQGAGFMAATYGRLTGKTGVCLSTLGPGATNLVTAAAYAQLGGMPLLMITGQKPIRVSKQGKFQIVDVVEMMRPLTKFTKQIVEGGTIPALIREAVRLSQEERPGAVHLELPEDIAEEQVTDTNLFSTEYPRRATASNEALQQAADMVAQAKRPLLLIGAAANRKLTSKALSHFLDKTGIPFINTQMGKGVVDERHPLYLGTAALSAGDYIHKSIEHADLIINVGHDIIEKPPFFMQHGGTQVIHINFFPAHVDQVYFPDLEVVGDITNSVCRLTDIVKPHPKEKLTYFYDIKDALDKQMVVRCDDERFPLLPQRLVHEVRQVMPEDGILALDNGMYKIWFARNYKAYQPNTILLDNALATMGAGLPSAIGVTFVHPTRKVVAVCGDGGFMMNSQEMETAVRLRCNLVILLLRDNAYGMIKWKQQAMDLADFGLDFGNPDFVKYAESYGARGHRVESAADFASCFEQSLNEPGIDLIEVPVDYSENAGDLGKNLREATSRL